MIIIPGLVMPGYAESCCTPPTSFKYRKLGVDRDPCVYKFRDIRVFRGAQQDENAGRL